MPTCWSMLSVLLAAIVVICCSYYLMPHSIDWLTIIPTTMLIGQIIFQLRKCCFMSWCQTRESVNSVGWADLKVWTQTKNRKDEFNRFIHWWFRFLFRCFWVLSYVTDIFVSHLFTLYPLRSARCRRVYAWLVFACQRCLFSVYHAITIFKCKHREWIMCTCI